MYARYTEYLRDLMMNKETAEALNRALSTYPLYKAKNDYDLIPSREELNKKILNHYKYREIGFETIGRFLDALQITMEEIMPLYNERFKTVEIMADLPNPFDNVDVIEEYIEESEGETTSESSGTNKDTSKRTGSGSAKSSDEASSETSNTATSSSESEQTMNGKSVKSETPQDNIANISSKNIDNITYADNVEWNKNEASNNDTSTSSGTATATSTSSSNSSSSSNENVENNGETNSNSSGTTKHKTQHTFTKKGNQGVNTYAHDMIEFRKAIIDVVNEIINDTRLNELFMNIF